MEGGKQSARVYRETRSDSWGPVLTTHVADAAHDLHMKKKNWGQQSCQLSGAISGCHVWRWLDADSTSPVWQLHSILTVVWERARICKREQHVQHGYGIGEFVKAVDVLVDCAEQLTYHPAERQVWCYRQKAQKTIKATKQHLLVDILETNLTKLFSPVQFDKLIPDVLVN